LHITTNQKSPAQPCCEKNHPIKKLQVNNIFRSRASYLELILWETLSLRPQKYSQVLILQRKSSFLDLILRVKRRSAPHRVMNLVTITVQILYKLSKVGPMTTIPTIGDLLIIAFTHNVSSGFNIETLRVKNLEINAWDIGGRSPIRPLWRYYYEGCAGLILVLDGNDRERLEYVNDELQRILTEDRLVGLPLLILLNKVDLPNCMSMAEVNSLMHLSETIKSRKYAVFPTCALTGSGIHEGLDWLGSTMV
jgi:ADP-ribosylation factor 6